MTSPMSTSGSLKTTTKGLGTVETEIGNDMGVDIPRSPVAAMRIYPIAKMIISNLSIDDSTRGS